MSKKIDFITKWSGWWMLRKDSVKLTVDFEKELNDVIAIELGRALDSNFVYEKSILKQIFENCQNPNCNKKLENSQWKFCNSSCAIKYYKLHNTLKRPRKRVVGKKGEETKEWESITECANYFKCSIGYISVCLTNEKNPVKGWILNYKLNG